MTIRLFFYEAIWLLVTGSDEIKNHL